MEVTEQWTCGRGPGTQFVTIISTKVYENNNEKEYVSYVPKKSRGVMEPAFNPSTSAEAVRPTGLHRELGQLQSGTLSRGRTGI